MMANAGDFDSFALGYTAGRAQIVWRRIVADLDTPVGIYLKLAEGRANTFLLESVLGGSTRARYSMIGVEPDLMFRVKDGVPSLNRQVATDPGGLRDHRRRAARCPEGTCCRIAGRIAVRTAALGGRHLGLSRL